MDQPSKLSGAGRAALAAAALGVGYAARAQAGPLNVALLGLGVRGQRRLAQLSRLAEVRVVAAADPDEATWGGAPAGVTPVADPRVALAADGVDAVLVCLPTHWTALAGVLALRAGRHVFLEPPAAWSFAEGQALLAAAAASDALAAVGHDGRGSAALRAGVARARGEFVGPIHTARAICYQPYTPRPATGTAAPPREVNWELWRGPANIAYRPELRGEGWLYEAALSPGELGGAALEPLDAARWLLGGDELPVGVHSSGGRFGDEVPGDTPNVQHAVFSMADRRSLAVEIRGLVSPAEQGLRVGAIAYGATGWLNQADGFKPHIGHDDKGSPPEDAQPADIGGVSAPNALANFVAAIAAGRAADINCPLTAGVRTAQYIALANIAYRLGRALDFDPAAEKFLGATDADALLARPRVARGFGLPA